MNGNIFFKADSETAAQAATLALIQCNFRVVRSFDLRSALVAHEDCTCPYHGTSHCTCQFVVLLVYKAAAGPVVITIHSYDTQARVQLVLDHLTQPNLVLAGQIMPILEGVAQAPAERTPASGAVPTVGTQATQAQVSAALPGE
jgi:hypothetical protein